MIVVARLITLTILLGFLGQPTPTFARASSFEDKTWDAGNVSVLPPEVHETLTRMCGPDLVAQAYFAGYFANSPEALTRWIEHPQELLPGNAMPDMGLSHEQARTIADYLYTVGH